MSKLTIPPPPNERVLTSWSVVILILLALFALAALPFVLMPEPVRWP